jgi:hypothetical protein
MKKADLEKQKQEYEEDNFFDTERLYYFIIMNGGLMLRIESKDSETFFSEFFDNESSHERNVGIDSVLKEFRCFLPWLFLVPLLSLFSFALHFTR